MNISLVIVFLLSAAFAADSGFASDQNREKSIERYFVEKDRLLTAIRHTKDDKSRLSQDEVAPKSLKPLMEEIIGGIHLPRLKIKGTSYQPDTLIELPTYCIDGLSIELADEHQGLDTLLVTDIDILKKIIRKKPLPSGLGDLFSAGIEQEYCDARSAAMADIPLGNAGVEAWAFLAVESQESIGGTVPRSLRVIVKKSSQVFFASLDHFPLDPPRMKGCEAGWSKFQAEREMKLMEYRRCMESRKKDQPDRCDYNRMVPKEDWAEAEYVKCYADEFAKMKAYLPYQAKASALVQLLGD